MDARPWQSSANRYYAFSGERLDLLHRISKTPPPPSTSSSRSPPSAIYTRKSAPTSPAFGSPTSLKSSLLARISPKGYPPQSRPIGDLPPLSPEFGGYLDAYLDEKEEEQVIRVLDNNRELVYQRDFGMDERQDCEGELHESRNSSPVKKRKLLHVNPPSNKSTPHTSPTQNKPNQKTKRTRSHSRSPPSPNFQSNSTSPSKKQPLASRLGINWSSGSPVGGGSTFGKRSGLTFGFAGFGYDTSAEVNTSGRATLRDRIEATPVPEPPQDDPHDDTHKSSAEDGKISGGTSLLRRIGSYRPIPDSELEALRQGDEDRPDHETRHTEGEATADGALTPPPPPPVLPPQSEDMRMDVPPPLRKSSSRTPNHEHPPESAAQPESLASSRPPTSPPEARTPPRTEVAGEGIKSMEQHAEDFLQDIQKEFLSKAEARASPSSTELGRAIPGLPAGGDASISSRDIDEPLRASPTPILYGMSPLIRARSISPLEIDHDITFDTMSSISAHTPRSAVGNLPGSIARSTSFPISDLDPNDVLLEGDVEVDRITKQALGDLIVHSLKLNHDLGANEGWENSDAVRCAIRQEVDEHARDFLRLAAKLARRMDLIREPRESTEVPDVEPEQLMVEHILPDTTENGHLEDLPLIESAEGNEELPPHEEDAEHVDPDVEMGSVPPEVPQSDPEEDKTEPSAELTSEQELDNEPTNEHLEHRVDHVDHVDRGDLGDYVDEGAFQEQGLEIPGVWCAHTGRDRTDTVQEQIEVSEAVAARVKMWAKGNIGFRE